MSDSHLRAAQRRAMLDPSQGLAALAALARIGWRPDVSPTTTVRWDAHARGLRVLRMSPRGMVGTGADCDEQSARYWAPEVAARLDALQEMGL